ncbi:MAG TPA: electron transport complex protein RnfG [Bacteroidales bacterium]|jgi:NADH:ubiquinone oxidoreductase subunit E|nr:electron transport complex protein RnfG [Bacteroidales bacterium]
MINKIQVKICLGSSCFSRGNQELVNAVQRYIREKQLEDKVAFSGDHCFCECQSGPNIRIAGKIINNVSTETIVEILDQNLTDI